MNASNSPPGGQGEPPAAVTLPSAAKPSETPLLDLAESLGAERASRSLIYAGEQELRKFLEAAKTWEGS